MTDLRDRMLQVDVYTRGMIPKNHTPKAHRKHKGLRQTIIQAAWVMYIDMYGYKVADDYIYPCNSFGHEDWQ